MNETTTLLVQEEDEVPQGRMVALLVATLAVVGLAVAIIALLGVGVVGGLEARLAGRRRPPVGPAEQSGVLQTQILTDRPGLRLGEAQRRTLSSYGWVDEPAGIVRIPIAEAMRLVAAGHREALAPGGRP